MSSAARFLLEFEATGDQEVVSKIKAVGEAGKQTATDLESLRGIEDPFEPIATGADAAVAPIEGVGTAAETAVTPIEGLGTAAEGAVSPLTDMGGATEELGGIFSGAGTEVETFGGTLDAIGTSGEAAAGGLTDANTMVGDFGESAATSGDKTSGFGSDVASVGGAVAALGGSIGTVVSTLFRYNAAQLSVEKANLAAARAAETYRKAEAAIDKILATATSNTDAIAAARARLSAAQTTLNDLVAAGVTSGPQYEAALAGVQEAQAALAEEAAKGGVDVAKLTDAMEKSELSAAKVSTTTKTAAKEQAELNKVILDSVFGFTSMGGSLVQVASAMSKGKDAAGNLITKMGGLTSSLTSVGLGAVAAYNAFVLLNQVMSAAQGFAAQAAGKNEEAAKKFKESWETAKTSIGAVGPGVNEISAALKLLGYDIDANMGKAVEKGKEMDASVDKNASTFNQLAIAGSGAGVGLEASATAMRQAKSASDEMSAALDTVTGNALEANKAATQTAAAINLLSDADIENINALHEHARAQTIANAGYNDAKIAAFQYQAALTAMTQSMVQDTDEKNANAKATLELANSNLNAQNTVATLREEYAQSVDRLADLSTTMNNAEAASLALKTALNEQLASLQEEEIELRASIAATDDKAIAQQELENAYLRGVASVDEWRTGLASAAAEEQGAIDRLADFGTVFSDLPGYMEPTVESLMLFEEAAGGSGEAAQAMADMASEAFQTMASDGQKLIEGLSDAILEGGEKMEENWQKAWEKMPQAVRDSMSTAQQEEVKAIAEMEAAAQAAVIELGIDLKTEDFATARADFTSNLQALASESDGIWSQMWSRAAELASTGSEAMVARVSEIVKSGDSPQIMLQQLEAAAKQFGPVGDSIGTNLMNGVSQAVTAGGVTLQSRFGEGARQMVPVAQQAGKESGIALSQEFAAAGTHIAAVIKGIKANIASIGTGVGTGIVIPVTVDVSQAGNAIASIVNTLSSLQPPPIKLTADVQQAGNAIASIVNTLSSLVPPPIKIQVDNSVALQQIQVVKTNLDNLKQSRIPPIAVNNAQAISQIRVVQTQLNAIKQTKIPTVKVNNAQAISQIRVVQTQLNAIKQTKIPTVRVNNSQALSQINRVKSALNSLKNITRTITYRYRTVGSPPRGAQSGMHERLSEDTLISAHKGERVDINPTGGPAIEKPGPTHTIYSQNGGRRGGGGSEIVIPVTLMLDNKVLIRTVRRGLVEEVSGTM